MRKEDDLMHHNKETVVISLVSNIVFEPYFGQCIKSKFSGKHTLLQRISYGEHKSYECQKKLLDSEVIVVWLNFEALCGDRFNLVISEQSELEITDLCSRLYDELLEINTRATILWFTFEDYYLPIFSVIGNIPYDKYLNERLNMRIYDRLCDKVCFIDLKHLIARVGIENSYTMKGKYRWNAPYSKKLICISIEEIYKQYLIHRGVTKKCLILDCDNVLWGGILSEDGIENIKIGGLGKGRSFQEFQKFIVSLYFHGVIIAICSKNELSDVYNVFRNHNAMILKEEHISCFKVNWENKPTNIKEIAETLNIGLDSMVFVDDSYIEVEAVKMLLPEVTSIIYEYDSVYSQLSCFNLKRYTDIGDITKRTNTYKTNQAREELKAKYTSYEEYLAALEIVVDIHEAVPSELSRVSELTQRTNRCSNGRRYTVDEIKRRILHRDTKLYSVSVSDCFCDLGIAGCVEVQNNVLTLFSMSCRALGRNIETKILQFISKKHDVTKIQFKTTGKNNDMKMLFLTIFPEADFDEIG